MWNKIICGLLSELSNNGLNFKKFFNSFKVETNKDGPRIRTFNLCIL